MTNPTLPYATKPAPLSGLTITVAEDEVALTKTPPRGLFLGALVALTALYAALWTMLAALTVKLIGTARSFGDFRFFWYGLASLAMLSLPTLLWTIGIAIGWVRYWRVGPVPFEVRITRDRLFVSRAGTLRAVSSRYFAPNAIRSVDLRPVRGSLTRKPLCEIIIRVRRRFPLTIRTAEPIDGAPRAFVDGAKRLLNLRP